MRPREGDTRRGEGVFYPVESILTDSPMSFADNPIALEGFRKR